MSRLDAIVYYGAAIGFIELICIVAIIFAFIGRRPALGIAAAVTLIVCVNLPFPSLELRDTAAIRSAP